MARRACMGNGNRRSGYHHELLRATSTTPVTEEGRLSGRETQLLSSDSATIGPLHHVSVRDSRAKGGMGSLVVWSRREVFFEVPCSK